MTLDWYDSVQTCNSVEDEAKLLAGMVRFLRDYHWSDSVALLGHSLGGVIAIQALMDYPDLTPFVRLTVALDSPFGGINGWLSAFGNTFTTCQSLEELGQRRALAQQWQSYYAAKLAPVIARGVRIIAVNNPQDDVVGLGAQCLCAISVNVRLSAPGHSAVLYDPVLTGQIAAWIGPQGQ